MKMKKVCIVLILSFFAAFACSGSAPAGKVVTLRLAVAGNLSDVILPLNEAFQKENPDTGVEIVIGSSGKLTSQIINGAQFDLFLAANMKYPEKLYQEKLATGKPVVYAKGALVLFSLFGETLGLKKRQLSFLKNTRVKHIAIANPELAPYGVASVEVMKAGGIYSSVRSKIVTGQNIKKVATMSLEAAEAGFIAKSLLNSKAMKKYNVENQYWIALPPNAYKPIQQGMVIVKSDHYKKKSSAIKKYYDFILSDTAGKIFKQYGYVRD